MVLLIFNLEINRHAHLNCNRFPIFDRWFVFPFANSGDSILIKAFIGRLSYYWNIDDGTFSSDDENNDNDVAPVYPASYNDPSIISVAALHGGGDLAVFSNFGANTVDIAAPGQDILSTIPTALAPEQNNPYAVLSGTSMASPHVAGAVALFWSYAPDLTAQEVKAELLASSVTGTFNKAVAGSRMMDLNSFMDAVKAKATLSEVGSVIKPENSTQFDIQLSTEARYAAIEKIEILHIEDVIGETAGDSSSVTIDLPLGFAEAEVYARVTDAMGRQYISEAIPLDIDLNKVLSFSDVDGLGLSGSSACKVSKLGDGGEDILYQANLGSKRECQKFCDVVGPMLYSSKSEIQCSQGSEIIYSAKN